MYCYLSPRDLLALLLIINTGICTSKGTNDFDQVMLDTKLGRIAGIKNTVNNLTVFQFKGIPFAKPPIGELRFKKPEVALKWNGTLNATHFGPACFQNSNDYYAVSEDCLNLNIYVPNRLNTSENKAVMIWVHGGSFTSGRNSEYDGSMIALLGDVIVVIANYRLNIFGFFSSGDLEVPGNMGLWDQRLAFIWVRDNIRDYGGDPNRITIFGESAGGDSVGLHSMIPKNIGLFQRVIAESGSSLRKRDFSAKSIDLSLLVAKEVGCSDGCKSLPSAELVSCLRGKEASDLLMAFYKSSDTMKERSFSFQSPVGPLVDYDLIPGDPVDLLADPDSDAMKTFKNLDYMTGTNTGETGLFYFDLIKFQKQFNFNASQGVPSRVTCQFILPSFVKDLYGDCPRIVEELCREYSPSDPSASLLDQTKLMSDMYLDIVFLNSTIATLDIHAKQSDHSTYQYVFAHVPEHGSVMPRPTWLQGADHVDEVPFVFGAPLLYTDNVNFSAVEKQLSLRMIKYWTNFAKKGNPNGNIAINTTWPKYTTDKKNYIEIADQDIVRSSPLFKDRMQFLHRNVSDAREQCITPPTKNDVIFNTTMGTIKGVKVNYPKGAVFQFMGIPYALPPTNSLRFKKPVSGFRWNGTLDATKYGPSCMQIPLDVSPNKHVNYSEDCLYLNIFVPRFLNTSFRLAVMVWIHGGGLGTGSSSDFEGSQLALQGNVIIVTINYRLNIFGFFSLGNNFLRGNYGLWDQRQALQWIKNNIQDYGGDPRMITIFGESAGGTSVGLQSLYPPNRGLFKRVIAESGSGFQYLGDSDLIKNVSLDIVSSVNCSDANASSQAIYECLQKIDSELLLHLSNKTWNKFQPTISSVYGWLRVDNDFILKDPRELMLDQESDSMKFFNDLDYMVGSNSGEGGLLYYKFPSYQKQYNFNIENGIPTRVTRNVIIPLTVRDEYGGCRAMTDSMTHFYLPTNNQNYSIFQQTQEAVDFFGDIITHRSVKTADLHSVQRNKATYLYHFAHPAAWSLDYTPSWLKQANHGDEVPFLFGLKTMYPVNITISQVEKSISNRIMNYWTNFAKTGNPTPYGEIRWPQYTKEKKSFLKICGYDSVEENLYPKRMKFWNEDIPTIWARCKGKQDISSDASAVMMTVLHVFVPVVVSFLIGHCTYCW